MIGISLHIELNALNLLLTVKLYSKSRANTRANFYGGIGLTSSPHSIFGLRVAPMCWVAHQRLV